MKRVLITGAGGSPAVNFTRSLRKAPEDYYLIGVDADEYSIVRAEVDERHLVPRASDPDYIPVLKDIITETSVDVVHTQHSQEIPTISEHRDELGAKTFLPSRESIKICDDKLLSFKCWEKAGLTVPRTMLLESEKDIDTAFKELGPRIWLRAIVGSGGAGATPATNAEWAKVWVSLHNGWGKFTAAEVLRPDSVIWQSIWKDGELVVAQGRRRIYWEMGRKFLSGVSGITGAGILVSDSKVDDIAQRTVLAIDECPNGVWGVDLTYDEHGTPNPTEINAGRFFTTHQFFTEAGLNMPYIYVKLALGERPPHLPQRINPLTPDQVWVRGVDFLPILTTLARINKKAAELQSRKARLA